MLNYQYYTMREAKALLRKNNGKSIDFMIDLALETTEDKQGNEIEIRCVNLNAISDNDIVDSVELEYYSGIIDDKEKKRIRNLMKNYQVDDNVYYDEL